MRATNSRVKLSTLIVQLMVDPNHDSHIGKAYASDLLMRIDERMQLVPARLARLDACER